MSPEELIAEGRQLERPTLFLRPNGTGSVAAVWHEHDHNEIAETGHRSWLTVDAQQIPGLPASITGYFTIFTDEEDDEGGRVERALSWPNRAGTPLYAHAVSVLPPIGAVFARGSAAVGQWIASLGWARDDPYGGEKFQNSPVVRKYIRVWMEEYPLYSETDVYAILGGWHSYWGVDDWQDLIDERLMVLTLRDSEPWVEAWQLRSGAFQVIRRIP